jgi:HEAT repeats
VADLIYKSQTACYGKQRAHAISKLGKYDCQCNPEILCAMVYGLNDADEHVRRESAEQIGHSLKKNPCCCSREVVAALTCALADCDRAVRRHAEKALRQCGYDVVDGCCKPGCTGPVGGCASAPMGPAPTPAAAPMAPAPAPATAPAPAPPEDSKAYIPSGTQGQQASSNSRLSNLFGLLD